MTPPIDHRLTAIRLLVLDVDGTLTDGGIYIDSGGQEFKRFDAHDGHGIKQLLAAGIEVALLSGRNCTPVELRAKELGIEIVIQGHFDKTAEFERLVASKNLTKEEVAAMGDDLSDLAMTSRSGCSFAPANAIEAVKMAVDYVTERSGGYGAVREVCDLILAARAARN